MKNSAARAPHADPPAGPAPAGRRRALLAALLAALVLATVTAYAPTARNGFSPYDDPSYVTENPAVLGGLTRAGVAWAFSAFGYGSNWHPLTWLSHMLDVTLFGLAPGPHHLVSLALHAAAAVLLVLALLRATGRVWASAAVGALFALHPLHVESVAWIAERKDVLAGFFWALCLLSYVGYARRPGLGRWLLVTLWFGCGLLAKPTVVTLPALLLLLDYWPLGRLGRGRGRGPSGAGARALLAEKAPWFLMSAAAAAVTLLVQQSTGAGALTRPLPLAARLAHAALAYCWYLAKALWPVKLSFFYPHPAAFPPLPQLAAALLLLGALSWIVVAGRRRRPYALVGWLWYLGTLVPMIGVVQVGAQAWADRYSYLPLTGLFVAVSWQVGAALRGRLPRAPAAAAVAAVLAACAVATGLQVRVWRDGETLFRHGLDLDAGNTVALVGLGGLRLRERRYDEAAAFFREAIERRPEETEAHLGLGVCYAQLGLVGEEAAAYERGLAAAPDDPRLLYNLILAYRDLGRAQEALALDRRLQAIKGNLQGAWFSRGFR